MRTRWTPGELRRPRSLMRPRPGISSFAEIDPTALRLHNKPSAASVSRGGSRLFTAASSQYAWSDDRAVFNLADNDWWIFAAVYPTSVAAGIATIISAFEIIGDDRAYVLQRSAATIQAIVSSDGTAGNATTVTSAVTLLANQWHFVLLTHDATLNELTLFVNGVSDVAAHAGGAYDSGAPLTLGAQYDNGNALSFWGGRVAIAAGGSMESAWGTDYTTQTLYDYLVNDHRGRHWSQITAAIRTKIGVGAYTDAANAKGFWFEGDQNPASVTVMQDELNAARTSRGFDGASDYGSITDAAQTGLDFTSATFTILAWIRRSVTGVFHYIISKGDSGTATKPGWALSLDNNDHIYVRMRDASNNAAAGVSVSTIADTNWHQLAVVCGSNLAKYFIDGAYLTGEDDSLAAIVDTLANAEACLFGSYFGAVAKFNGRLRDVAVYNTALSAATIAKHYASGNPDNIDWTDPDLDNAANVGRWLCNETIQAANIQDTSGNANHLTNNGSIQVAPGPNSTTLVPADAAAPTAAAGIGAGKSKFLAVGDTEYYAIPDGASTRFGTSSAAISVMFRVNSLAAADHRAIASKGTASNTSSWQILVLSNSLGNKLRFVVSDGTTNLSVDTTTAIVANRWYHAVCLLDQTADTISIMLDGVLDGTPVDISTITGGIGNEAADILVGVGRGLIAYYDGWICRLKVWKRTLSVDEVQDDMQGGDPLVASELATYGLTGSLVGAWDADKVTANLIEDYVGDGTLDGVETGGTIVQSYGPGPPGRDAAVDGEPVATLYGSSGYRRIFGQTTIGQAPLWDEEVASALNEPGLYFDGVDDYVRHAIAATLAGTQSTVALIAVPHDDSGDNVAISSADEASTTRYLAYQMIRNADGIMMGSMQNNNDAAVDSLYGSTIVIAGVPHLFIWLSDGSIYRFYLDNVLQTITAAIGANNGDTFGDTSARDNIVIGALKTSAESLFEEFTLLESGVWNTPLPLSELEQIADYARETYGITGMA